MLKYSARARVMQILVGKSNSPGSMPKGGHETVEEMVEIEEGELIEKLGLAGDRWFGIESLDLPCGAKEVCDHKRHVSLINQSLEKVLRQAGFQIAIPDLRRNIVVEDFEVERLVGQEFFIGSCLLRGTRECHGCSRVEKLTGVSGLIKALHSRGGIRAEVLKSGRIKKGDFLRCIY